MFRLAYGFGHGDMELVHEYAHALYFESAAMILTLVTGGQIFRGPLQVQNRRRPGQAGGFGPQNLPVVLRGGVEQTIPAEQVVAGDIVVIRPGEGIPVDGVVTEGHGYVDQAAITGESIPVEKNPGDQVISATLNKNGTFQFQASKVGRTPPSPKSSAWWTRPATPRRPSPGWRTRSAACSCRWLSPSPL